MTQDARRPLHRLTPLRDDPAAAWLSPGQRFQVLISKWISWVVFAILLRMLFWAQMALMWHLFRFIDWRLPAVFTGMAGVALIWPARRIILRRRSAKIAALVHESTQATAVAINDFSDL